MPRSNRGGGITGRIKDKIAAAKKGSKSAISDLERLAKTSTNPTYRTMAQQALDDIRKERDRQTQLEARLREIRSKKR